MSHGLKLLSSSGRLALSTDNKNYVFLGKYNPATVLMSTYGTPAARQFDVILPTTTPNNIIPFVRSVSGTTVGIFYIERMSNQQVRIRCLANGGPSTTTNYEVYVFSEIVASAPTGYGMRTFDASGNLTFDSNQKLLRVVGAARCPLIPSGPRNPLPTINLDAGTVPVNHAIFCTSMGKYDRMGDNPSAFYYPKSVQRQGIHVRRLSSTQLLCDGTGLFDSLYFSPGDPSFNESPSFIPVQCPGGAQILVIDTNDYA